LHSSGSIGKAVSLLEGKGFVEFREGAKWFKSAGFGDEKDRVVIRSNGSPTYLAADIAYHYRKLNGGFDKLINVWGADHHGYIPRLKAVIEALGFSPDALDIVLIQLVKLRRSGKPVAMSTRAGEFVTLREVIDEVGKDSMRFFMLMRRSDAQLDFDLELAKRQSMENPVYYVQYAHARICSLLSFADESGLGLRKAKDVQCELLEEKEELDLIKVLSFFPEVVEGSARSLEPHRLTGYLQRLASGLHNFYDRLRVVGEEEEKALARLALVKATQITLQNGLRLLGISCPERM
jgi:arginyl-tRNA synthetase